VNPRARIRALTKALGGNPKTPGAEVCIDEGIRAMSSGERRKRIALLFLRGELGRDPTREEFAETLADYRRTFARACEREGVARRTL
jgi:hypothetical protein